MKHDEWRPIPGFEGCYSVSTRCDIRRDAQPVTLRTKRGYSGYTISKPGRRSSHWVHTLVAAVFLGPRPAGHQIHHKNGNRLDNAIENLEYLSPQDHTAEHRQRRPYIGVGNPKSKLTDENVRAIRAIPRRTINWDALAAQYGV